MKKVKEEVVEQVVLETKVDTSEEVIIPNLDEEKEDVVVSDFKYEDTLFGLDEMLFDFKLVVNPSENILVCIQHVECIQKLLQKEINNIEVVDAEIAE